MMVTTRRTWNRATNSPTMPHSDHKPPTPATATPLSNTKPFSSSQHKSVFLHEWWLVKPQEGKGLAVGGLASLERERVFLSAVIAERHEANVLVTEDGITIIFRGFISSSHTRANGFPSQVCEHFLFGFPRDWKKYTAHSFGDEYIDGVAGFGDSNAYSQKRADDTLPFSIHVVDLIKTREFLLPNDRVMNYCLPPGKSVGKVSKQSKSTDSTEYKNTMKTLECACKDNIESLKTSQPQACMMHNGENGILGVGNESLARSPKRGQSLIGMSGPKVCAGLSRRTSKSPISIKKMRKEQLSSKYEKKCTRQKILEDASKSCRRMMTRSISQKMS